MNKKVIAVIGISGALMLGSVYSISANSSGYDLYKSALKNTHQLQSSTMDVSFDLQNNDKNIFSADYTIKNDSVTDGMEGNGTVTNGIKESSYEMYKQDGQWLVKKQDENKVYVKEKSSNPHGMNTDSKELQEDMEKLVDALTKNLQQKITVAANQDGTKEVELNLSSSEIPLAANVISSMMLKHAVMFQEKGKMSESEFHDVQVVLPELKNEIAIEEVKVNAQINEKNFVESQTVSAIVVGKDAAGKIHELKVSFKIQLSDVGQTEVERFDLNNENLEIVEFNHGHGKK